MNGEPTLIRYQPRPNATSETDPPRTVPTTAPMRTPPVYAPTIVTGAEARDALRSAVQNVWSTDPALRGVRGELERIGQDVEAPAYREIAERTRFGSELKAEARRLGLRRLIEGAWGKSK